jgi:Domain of unknown function (DUF4115)
MPEGFIERLVCLAALITLGALVALTVPRWQEHWSSKPLRAEPALGAASASNGSGQPGAGVTAAEDPLPRAFGHSLRLTAERGQCWLFVRKADERGRMLYAGTLSRGRSVSLAGSAFWVRMGAGQNLSAEFDGEPVRALPRGAATVSVELGAVTVIELG